jgi:hypothetical protein
MASSSDMSLTRDDYLSAAVQAPAHDLAPGARFAASVLWRVVRLPVLALLVILEPIIAFGCSGLALLGILTTLLFKLVGVPHFPALTMLMLSLGFVFVLIVYEGLIRVLSR